MPEKKFQPKGLRGGRLAFEGGLSPRQTRRHHLRSDPTEAQSGLGPTSVHPRPARAPSSSPGRAAGRPHRRGRARADAEPTVRRREFGHQLGEAVGGLVPPH
ncbi:hypothetical protein THAOC_15288, partial [Thalassiosira oceanica]